MRHLSQIFIIIVFVLSTLITRSYAGNLEKGFERLKIYDYFKAKYYFEKCLKKQTAGAAYGLSLIYAINNNPFYNLDSARIYILLAESAYKATSIKSLKVYEDLAITYAGIQQQKDTICQRALIQASTFNTIEKYTEYLNNFSFCTQAIKAVELRNSVAFEATAKINTAAAYKAFLEQYPNAKENATAVNKYEERLYKEQTQDQKITSYQNFIKNHPQRPDRIQADNIIFELSTPQKTVEQFEAFIKKNQGNRNVNQAWHDLYAAYMKNYSDQLFEKFKSTYPDYPFMNELEMDYRLQQSLFLPFSGDSLWGYINETGKEMIKPVYEDVNFFSEGLAAVMKNGKYGYINKQGKTVIDFIYDDAEPFKNNTAVVAKDDLYGLINRNGDELIPFRYDELSEPADEICMAVINEKSGYVNLSGKRITEFEFDYASDFINGFAIVAIDGLYGTISNKGSISIEPKYDDLTFFTDKTLKAKQNNKYGLIDFAGGIILPFEFDHIQQPANQRALVVKQNKCGFIDDNGKLVIAVTYPVQTGRIEDVYFENGYAIIYQKTKALVIDSMGNKFTLTGFDFFSKPSEEIIAVSLKKKWGYADKNGKLKINLKYELAGDFNEGRAVVRSAKKYGVIDKNGNYIIQPLYTAIQFKNKHFIINSNGKYGLCAKDGKLIFEPEYQRIELLSEQIVAAYNSNNIKYYNMALGKIIFDSGN